MTLTRTYNFYKRTPSGRCYNKTTYGLPRRNWNQHLTDEFAVYRQWRTAPLNLDRPANLLQRDITFDKTV